MRPAQACRNAAGPATAPSPGSSAPSGSPVSERTPSWTGAVALVEAHEIGREPRRAAHQQRQQSGREWIERAGVADLDLAASERAAHARDAAERRRPGGLVDEQHGGVHAPAACRGRPRSRSTRLVRREPGGAGMPAAAPLAGDRRAVEPAGARAQRDLARRAAAVARLAHERGQLDALDRPQRVDDAVRGRVVGAGRRRSPSRASEVTASRPPAATCARPSASPSRR